MTFNLVSLRLKKTVCFEDAEFKISPGISVIYGLNRTNARTSGNGNGSGKSSFFSQIGEILYEMPIVGERQDSVKSGSRVLKAQINGKPLTLGRVGNKAQIAYDGKKKKFRTKALAREYVRNLLPITQEEFQTYVHLDARVPHPLVMGSSTERKRFFTSFFGLDKLDIERKLFAAELSSLSKVRAAYSALATEYKAAKVGMLPDDKVKSLKAKIKAYAVELESLNEKNTKLQTINQLLAFEASAKPQLKVLATLCPDGVTIESFEELEAASRRSLVADKAGLEDAQSWEQYQRDNAHYTKALEKLSSDAAKLIAKLGKRKALSRCTAALETVRELKAQVKELTGTVRTREAQLSEPMLDKVEQPEGDKKELAARLESLTHQYEHARKFKAGTCDTCGQSVKVKSPEELKQRITSLKKVLAQFEAHAEYTKAQALCRKHKEELAEAQSLLDAALLEINKHKRYADLVEELSAVPNKPVPFEGRKLEVKVMQRMVDEDRERMQLLEFLRPNLDTIMALAALTEKQRSASAVAVRLQDRINEVHERLAKLRSKLDVQIAAAEGVARVKRRLVDMKAQLANEKPLKLLVEAYSDKAMKKMAIKAISSRLMTEVNRYARFVFPEDYTFEFNWDTSQLALIVKRRYGKRVLTSDVRKLSGAESKLFTIVLVLALLTFVPSRKRSNVLIMDEPTANMSKETTKSLMELLPILNKVIPSIIVITPKSEERYDGAQEFTVLKDSKGYASIVKGHPSAQR